MRRLALLLLGMMLWSAAGAQLETRNHMDMSYTALRMRDYQDNRHLVGVLTEANRLMQKITDLEKQKEAAELLEEAVNEAPKRFVALELRWSLTKIYGLLWGMADDPRYLKEIMRVARDGSERIGEFKARGIYPEGLEWLECEFLGPFISLGEPCPEQQVGRCKAFYAKSLDRTDLTTMTKVNDCLELGEIYLYQRQYKEAQAILQRGLALADSGTEAPDDPMLALGIRGYRDFFYLQGLKMAILAGDREQEKYYLDHVKHLQTGPGGTLFRNDLKHWRARYQKERQKSAPGAGAPREKPIK